MFHVFPSWLSNVRSITVTAAAPPLCGAMPFGDCGLPGRMRRRVETRLTHHETRVLTPLFPSFAMGYSKQRLDESEPLQACR
jgi:hypothetical protein